MRSLRGAHKVGKTIGRFGGLKRMMPEEISPSKKEDERIKDEIQQKNKQIEEERPPEKPLPGDCCGSGCERCVWDVYYEQLEAYENQQRSKPH